MSYDKAMRARVLALVGQGMSPRSVSDELGGSPSHVTIYNWMREEGIEYVPARERRPRGSFTARQKAEAVQRVEEGEDPLEVARSVGCASTSLLVWRNKLRKGGTAALRTRVDDQAPAGKDLLVRGLFVSGADVGLLAREAAADALESLGCDPQAADEVANELGLVEELRHELAIVIDDAVREVADRAARQLS